MQVETNHHLWQAWGSLAKVTGHTKVSYWLFRVCGPLRMLRKSEVWAKAGCFCGGGGTSFQRITRVWLMVLAKLMGSSDLVSAWTVPSGLWKGSQRESWWLPVLPSLERAVLTPTPPALTLNLVILVLFFPCAPGIFKAVISMIEPKVSEFLSKWVCAWVL